MPFGKISNWIIFPWLIASYPILFLYAENFSLVTDTDVPGVLALTLALTTVVFIAARILIKDVYKGAACTSAVIMAFFLYGHLVNLLSPVDDPDPVMPLFVARIAIFVVCILVLAVVFFFILRMKSTQKLHGVVPYVNLISAVLLCFVVAQTVSAYLKTHDAISNLKVDRPAREAILDNSPERPDIYYIILDGYSSNTFLLREYGYDNSAFTDALEKRGFFVAYDSLSNYGITLASLPSSLNMRYLTDADRSASTDSVGYARWLLANNTTAYNLQERGYEYIFMMSGQTSPSNIADINIDFFPDGPRYFETNEFQDNSWFYKQSFWPLAVETTMAYPFVGDWVAASVKNDRPYDKRDPQRALVVFDEAEKVPAMKEATFSFIHVLKPHAPVVFDRDGNIISEYPELGRAFFAQLEFINRRTLQLIDNIIEHSSVPPIIILQADHGSDLGNSSRGFRDQTFFEILNAYYFPNGGDEMLSPSITPVNSFRVMFNYYFDTHYELLENHHYNVPDRYKELFNFVEVDIESWRKSWED